jgi:hypothetical protein
MSAFEATKPIDFGHWESTASSAGRRAGLLVAGRLLALSAPALAGGAFPNRLPTPFPILRTAVIHPIAGQHFEATMQDYKEIDRIRKNLAEVRSLAKRLLELSHADWNDWEIDFLQHMARHKRPDPITTRQCEKLLELRDDVEYYSSVCGFSVQSLIKNCWLTRDDLDSEDDRKFIEQLKETSCLSIKRRKLRKLLACARRLGEIEQYVSIDG